MFRTVLNASSCYRCLASRTGTNIYIVTNSRGIVTSQSIRQVRKAVSPHVSEGPKNFGEKAKEATKTTYYTAVVIAGIGVTGLMLYGIFKELLSSFSPQAVYSKAAEKCTENKIVCDRLGGSIKSYGEESRRGRRQHINHFTYEVEGVKGLRIRFYLKGQIRSGTVHLDARETKHGWEFRYLFVQLDSYPHQVIVIEDNRNSASFDTISHSEATSLAPINDPGTTNFVPLSNLETTNFTPLSDPDSPYF